MKREQKYLIGFDRFVDLNWANHAYYLEKKETNLSKKIELLKDYLSNYIEGKDSIRKTANLLSRIWFLEYPDLEKIKAIALKIDITNERELLIFHWGLSFNIFPFFKEVTNSIGKLLFLQGSFNRIDIESRLLAKYSNISSVPRAAQRIVQSLESWKIIKKGKGRILFCKRENAN